MHKTAALLAFGIFVIASVVVAAADWRTQAFDSIIGVNPLVLTPTYSWNDSCAKAIGAPTLFYSNSPEKWTPGSTGNWLGQNHVLLGEGELTPPKALIAFHFFNTLGQTATLNFGIDPKSTATFGSLIGTEQTGANAWVVGAFASKGFLGKYVPLAGFPTATPHGGLAQPPPAPQAQFAPNISISPRKIASWSVPNNTVISAEFELPNLSQTADFFLYACTANCTSTYTVVAAPDSNHQRGYFPDAAYVVHYDYTPSYIPNGGSAFEVFGLLGGCTPNVPGSDLLDASPGPNATLVGNYGVPIDVYGAAAFSAHSQRFGLNPRGGFPYIGAAWVASLINPATDATVSSQAYVLPTTTPVPPPSATPAAIATKSDSALLGFDQGSGHTIIYMLPGGNNAPVEMWDYVITPPPASARRTQGGHAQ